MTSEHVARWGGLIWGQRRVVAGIAATAAVATGIVVGWDQAGDRSAQVRLHSGVAWVASGEVGQLTLLDGASAGVAAQVQVDQPGSDLYAVQQGAVAYALNRTQGSVVRVDAATLAASRATSPMAGAGGRLAVFPTPHALYALDTVRGLLAKADPETLESQGDPHPLTVGTSQDRAATDLDGRLWVLDQRSGDLVWFADGTRHSRPRAHTPGMSRLIQTESGMALLDSARGTMELLDPDTGMVKQLVQVPTGLDDTVAVNGSAHERRLLIAVGASGLFVNCSFDTDSCAAPIELSRGSADLGQPVEADGHAVVPDYANGRVWIIDLAGSRVVAERRLFDRPVRFELLTRDGVVFYNDPRGEQAGVIDIDGRIRPITKYQSGRGSQAPSSGVATSGPAAASAAITAPPGATPGNPRPSTQSASSVTIGISPRDRGIVGDEFQFTAIAKGGAGVTSAQWTFGDGMGAAGTMVRHRFDRAGTYSVAVAARLRYGQVANASAQVVVDSQNTPPRIVRINIEPDAPRVGEQVRFSAELTGMRPDSMAWTVTGDGNTEATSNAPTFQHVFARPGAYTVSLAVTLGAVTVRDSRQFTVTSERREVRCGDVITTDAVVTQDLVCPGDVGVTVAADNVVLDLGGHTISADGPSAAGKGILVSAGRPISNVTIRNGVVNRFQTGVEMINVTGVTVANFSVTGSPMAAGSTPGIVGDRARDVRLRSVTVNTYHPFKFDHGSSVVFTGSTLTSPLQARGAAACAHDSLCTIERSSITVYALVCYGGDEEQTNASVTINDRSKVSIVNLGAYCSTATVANNDISTLADVSAMHAYITGNEVTGNSALNLWISYTVTGNVFRGSERAGLLISAGKGVVKGNTFVGNPGNGVDIPSFTSLEPIGPLDISENEFVSNGHGGAEFDWVDGLRVGILSTGSVVVVSRNRTSNNYQYGIKVERLGDVVGEGNKSSGDPEGCLNIDCS